MNHMIILLASYLTVDVTVTLLERLTWGRFILLLLKYQEETFRATGLI